MKCPKCDKEISDDSLFCEYCGTRLSHAHNNKRTPLIIALCTIVVALILTLSISVQREQRAAEQRAAEQRAAEQSAAESKKQEKRHYQGYIELTTKEGNTIKWRYDGYYTEEEFQKMKKQFYEQSGYQSEEMDALQQLLLPGPLKKLLNNE